LRTIENQYSYRDDRRLYIESKPGSAFWGGTMDQTVRADLIRNTIAIAIVCAMLAACMWILKPFLPAVIWASMIVIATWPLMIKIQHKLGGKRRPAALVMMAILILLFVIPLALAIGTIVENAPQIPALGKKLSTLPLPKLPEWVENVPLVGDEIAGFWKQIVEASPEALAEKVTPYVKSFATWMVAQAGSFGMVFVHFLLTLILSALLYMNGEAAAEMVKRFARRVDKVRGEDTIILAGNAIRAVALGVIVTALVQALLAGISLAVVGIPYASLLTALIFMLTIAQVGAGPVLIPAVLWLYWSGNSVWGTAMLIWAVGVMGLDNILRPVLIRKSANLPLLLVFSGVIGGLIAFGLIGLFIGPVLLAVGYTLFSAWIDENDEQTTQNKESLNSEP
jgi:predicted PurR-regulated permease PerM